MADPAAVLVAARDEEATIAATVAALREQFPGVEVIVADDGSRDATAALAEGSGARVLQLPRRGKGQALTLAEQAAPPGSIVLADADLVGDLRPLAGEAADLVIAAFAERRGGGFGIAKRMARELIRLRSGFAAREPLSGQRRLSDGGPRHVLPARGRLRVRGADDDRRRSGGARRLGDRASPRPLRHRARPTRLRAPRPPARRRAARGRPAGGQSPRAEAADRRVDARPARATRP